MFATTWSNPSATNAVIGKRIARILPPMSVAASASQIARHTSQLHPTARRNCSQWVSVAALPEAIAPRRMKPGVALPSTPVWSARK